METYAFFSSPFKPMLARGSFFPLDVTLGVSFSLVPDGRLSADVRLSTETVRFSLDTRLVPCKADPLDPPLGLRDLLIDLGVVDGRPMPIPNPMAAFGVAPIPVAFSGDTPNPRAGARRSCITPLSFAAVS